MFDINKVEIKYIIGSYIDEPSYPTPNDIIYMMTKRSVDKCKNLDPVTFTDNNLFKKLNQKYHENAKTSLDNLIKCNIIEVTRESNSGRSYKINKNKYINGL